MHTHSLGPHSNAGSVDFPLPTEEIVLSLDATYACSLIDFLGVWAVFHIKETHIQTLRVSLVGQPGQAPKLVSLIAKWNLYL